MAGTALNGAGAPRVSQQPSKSQRAYDWIKQRINDGRYVPGFRLVLGQIAGELEISVVPVREAIRRLEAEGLVTFERNVGAQVALLHDTEYTYTMQTLALVEGAATRMSAPLLTQAQLRHAHEINLELAQCLERFVPHRFTELNRQFHSVLFEDCPNPHILDLVQRGWNRLNILRDSIFGFVPGRAHESVAEHEQLLTLLESDAEPLQIELAAREHRLATLDAFLAYQNDHKLPVPPAA